MDLNADVGESFGRWTLGDDAGLLAVVTSANVACGFHAGDPLTLQRTCALAHQHGVTIGAQVGYRDLAGFGRRFIDVGPADLSADVLYQIGALAAMARAAGSEVRYVKPHGALYLAVMTNHGQATAIVDAICAYDGELAVLGLPGSVLLKTAQVAGLRTVTEAFVDRAYRADATLVPRSEAGALLHDPAQVAERAVQLAVQGTVTADDGSLIEVSAESLCVHGDTPNATVIAAAVRGALIEAGVDVNPFIAPR
jgi:UPF0271 protein